MAERKPNALRKVVITPDYTVMAAGSVLIECGQTRVLCTASVTEGVPPFKKGTGSGWLTAEYAMLPGSTSRRKASAETRSAPWLSTMSCSMPSELATRTRWSFAISREVFSI